MTNVTLDFQATKELPFWVLISTPLTNLGRQNDSTESSTPNLELQEFMIGSRGWGIQFPCVAFSMKLWPFEKRGSVPHGMEAQAYVDEEMKRRALLQDVYVKGAVNEEGRLRLEAFTELYCKKLPDGKHVLHELTVKNAFWVHSGHQRTEYVFLNAYALFKTRMVAQAAPTAIVDELPELSGFKTTVPTIVGSYDPKEDVGDILLAILKDQVSANMSAGKQNKLQILDGFKAAVLAIGDKVAPCIKERPFRDLFASSTEKGANTGALPRWAFLLGMINWFYGGKLEFAKKLFAPPKIDPNGEKNIDNPDYIDVREVALSHEDPMSDASVLARLMEPSLEKLKAYVPKFGHRGYDREEVMAKPVASLNAVEKQIRDGKPDPVSAIEYAVYDRSACYTLEESMAWIRSKCKGAGKGVYFAPKVTPVDKTTLPAAVVTAITQTVTSDRTPDAIRAFNAKFTNTQIDAKTPVDPNADVKAQELKGPLDAIWSLKGSTVEKLFLKSFETGAQLKDGNPPAFEPFVNEFAALVAKYTTPQQDSSVTA